MAIDTFTGHNAYAAACMAYRYDAGQHALPEDAFPLSSWSSKYQHDQQQIYVVCMRQCILTSAPCTNMGALLLGLSDAYAWVRSMTEELHVSAGTQWVAPARFQRETTKFWIRPPDAMRFKAEMIKHVPILIYGGRPGLSGGLTAPRISVAVTILQAG